MAETDVPKEKIRYAVVGDSYSCGEGAKPTESWPSLLTQHLKREGMDVDLVSNPSVTGWTTKDAIDKELPKFVRSNPNFATLLIGVNDWVQGIDETTFRNRVSYLIDQMLAVLPNKKWLLVVTIPDFGITPTGPKYARGRNIHDGITQFNKIVTEEAHKRGLEVVDIFPLSKKNGTRQITCRYRWFASISQSLRRVGEDYFSGGAGVAETIVWPLISDL